MGAAGVLRRSLLIWGWGHLALGDMRGWLLVLLQPIVIAGVAFAGWQLVDGTRWLAVFLPLVALLALWIAQAVHAHQRALVAGAAPGGELQLALVLPILLAVVSAFWLVGGRHGSPASAVEAYMTAWRSDRPDVAVALYGDGGAAAADVAQLWTQERAWLKSRIEVARQAYGAASGLDAARPFGSLRVTQSAPSYFIVELVRSESYQTTILGFIPTAGQRTVVVAQLLAIAVKEEPINGYLPSSVWRIDRVMTLH